MVHALAAQSAGVTTRKVTSAGIALNELMSSGVMCVTGYELVCSSGGRHALESGPCYWNVMEPAEK